MSEAAALGVDFGTSHTVAISRAADGRVRPLLVDGSPLLPSAVYAQPDGALVVGRDAVHSARLDPARFEPNPKRRIDDGTVLLGDREVTVTDLVTAVLARVAEEWRRAYGDAPPRLTLTCPASWGATRRGLLADAAARAGLGAGRLVVEPVAAATYFAEVLGRDVPIGSAVLVYDFGAGTFDASVVVRRATGFEVVAVDGRADLGGLDVDAALVAHLAGTLGPRDPAAWQRLTAPGTVADRRAKRQLWDDVRVAKERLSRSPTADLVVPLLDLDVHLTRDELERLAEPVLAPTVAVTRAVLRSAALPPGNLAGLFLVGGSSRIPLVATLLLRALGVAPVAIEQPELVVAEGSILAATAPLASAPAAVATTGEVTPVPDPPAPVSPASVRAVAAVAPPTPMSPAREVPAYLAGRAPVVPRKARSTAGRPPAVSRSLAPADLPPPPREDLAPIWAADPRPTATRRRPGPFVRAVRALVILALLVATPVVAALLAYREATGDSYTQIFDSLQRWIADRS